MLSKVEKFILAKPLNIIRWKKHGNSVLFLLFNYNAIYSSPPIDSAYVNTLLVSVDELCPQTPFVRAGGGLLVGTGVPDGPEKCKVSP